MTSVLRRRLCACLVLGALIVGRSINIPVGYYDVGGSPWVNFTMADFGKENETMPMMLTFDYRNEVGYPCSQNVPAFLQTSNGERFPITDRLMSCNSREGSISSLTLRRNRWIRNSFGPIAFTGSDLILNASREEFLSSCDLGTNMTVMMHHVDTGDKFRANIFSDDGEFYAADGLEIQIRSLTDRMIGLIPTQLYDLIGDKLYRQGASRLEFMAPFSNVANNCSPSMLESLPRIVYQFGNIQQLVLDPQDYIEYSVENMTCALRLRNAATVVGLPRPAYFFNPLMIKGLNFRISNDVLTL